MDEVLGLNIRALRKVRGLTLVELAAQVGCSVGWLSQVERGLSRPGDQGLTAISAALRCPVSLLFGAEPGPEPERGFVVRAGDRRSITARQGLSEELLSPDLTDGFEVIRSVFAPGAELGETRARDTQEVGYVVSGKLDLTIAGRRFTVAAGDSFRIRGDPFTWANPHAEPAIVIWVISPPVY